MLGFTLELLDVAQPRTAGLWGYSRAQMIWGRRCESGGSDPVGVQ